MGKGLILSHIGDAQYSVRVLFDTESYQANLARLQAQIDYYTGIIDELPAGEEKENYKLLRTAEEKRKATLITQFPANPIETVWCTDRTEDLSGDIGLCEVPGDRQEIIIQPGYDDNAVYNQTRDGQIRPAAGCSPAELYYNLAMLPGWQKWKPTFRIGTIVAGSIDTDADTCSVCLIPAFSQEQNLGINQTAGYGSCEVDAHSGFTTFCSNNPDHPLCNVSSPPANALTLTETVRSDLRAVNSDVNDNHDYRADVGGYAEGDSWEIMGAGESGDCEDFALTKADELIALGYDPEHLRIATAYTETGQYHAVLMVETSGGTYVLDNRNSLPMLEGRLPYRWDKRQKAGLLWEKYSVLLEDVPVEYMGTGAGTFQDGDEVLVEFQSQDFNDPKVIGYRTNPRSLGGLLVIRSRTNQNWLAHPISGPDIAIVFNMETNALADNIPDGVGGFLSFPCDYADLDYWISQTSSVAVKDYLEKTRVGNRVTTLGCTVNSGVWCCEHEIEHIRGECGIALDSKVEENSYSGTDTVDVYCSGARGQDYDPELKCCDLYYTGEVYHHIATFGYTYLVSFPWLENSYTLLLGDDSDAELIEYDYEYLYAGYHLNRDDGGDCRLPYISAVTQKDITHTYKIVSPLGNHDTVEFVMDYVAAEYSLWNIRQNVEGARWENGAAIFISGINSRESDNDGVYGDLTTDVHASTMSFFRGGDIFAQARNSVLETELESLFAAAFATDDHIRYGYVDLDFDLRQ